MIEIKDLEVFFININKYLEKEEIKEIFEKNLKILEGAKITILDENDIGVSYFLNIFDVKNHFSHLCDYIKYYYLTYTDSEYCLYIDLDLLINKEMIDFILNNPNNFYVQKGGISSLLFTQKDKNYEFKKVFKEMIEFGFDKYFELGGDKYYMDFYKEENKKLKEDFHLKYNTSKYESQNLKNLIL
jgi:hypothetical protein